MAVAAAQAASLPMIALRIAVAALLVSAAPLRSGAQYEGAEAGVVPSDWNAHGRALAAAKRHREAIAAFERAMQESNVRAEECAWFIARSYAALGNRKQALRWVERAVDLGFDRDAIRRAPELARYRDDPVFEQLLSRTTVSNLRVAI